MKKHWIKQLFYCSAFFFIFVLFLLGVRYFSLDFWVRDSLRESLKNFESQVAGPETKIWRQRVLTGKKTAEVFQEALNSEIISVKPEFEKKGRSLRGLLPGSLGGQVFGVYAADYSRDLSGLYRLLGSLDNISHHLNHIHSQVFNTYFISKEQWIVINPAKWVNRIEAGHIFEKDVFYSIGTPGNNPMKKPVFSRLYYDDIWEKWMTTLVIPIYNGNEFLGIVGHDFIVDSMFIYFVDGKLNTKGTLYLVDRDFKLIMNREVIPDFQKREFNLNDPLPSKREKQDFIFNYVSGYMRETKKTRTFIKKSNQKLHVWSERIPELGWTYLYVINHRKISREFSERLDSALVWVLLGYVFVSILTMIFVNLSMLKPLRSLIFSLENIKKSGRKQTMEPGKYGLSIINDLYLQTHEVVDILTANVIKIEESKEYIETLMKTVQVFIAVLDCKLRPIDINDYGLQQLGISRREIGSLDIDRFFGSRNLSSIFRELESPRGLTNREMEIYLPGGRKMDVDASISKMYDSEGNITNYIAVFADITQRKKAEVNLQNQIAFSRQIFKTIPDMIVITDLNLKVIFTNERARKLFQNIQSVEKKIGDYLSESSLGSGFDEYLRNAIKNGDDIKQINVQNPFQEKENFVDLIIEPIKVHSGVIGALILTRDITEWRDLTNKLQNLQAFMERLIDASPYSIISVDQENRITVWNARAEQLFGFSSQEAVNRDIFECCPLFRSYRDIINEVRILGKTWALNEEMIYVGENNQRIVNIDFYSVQSGGRSVVVNIQDITEIKQLENSLMQAQKMESLGLLTSGIIHDFNNLLSGIMGYASLLEKKTDKDPRLKKYVSSILNSSERASQLIKQILEYSKKKMAKREVMPVNEMIEESLGFLEPHLRSIAVKKELCAQERYVSADRTRLSQVIINLVINAKDALKNKPDPMITIGSEEVDSSEYEKLDKYRYVKIKITDNGRGIRPEHIERIFEPFFTTKARVKGTGIGLATVNEIIKDYNGVIKVESEFGTGSSFSIYLPVVRPGKETKAADTPRDMKRLMEGWALLIDDEDVVREIGSEMLHSIGVKCLTAANGEEGIRLFVENREQIGLVILDIEMPGISGDRVYYKLKEIDPDVRVLFASGYAREYLERRYFGEKIKHFIAKPFQIKQLLEKISDLLED